MALGNGQVTSDGVPFVWWPTMADHGSYNLKIKPTQSLDCGMPAGSFEKQGVNPYYFEPNFVVLGTNPSTGQQDPVEVQARAEFSRCGLLPSWYVPSLAHTTVDDFVVMSQKFAGTALLMDDEAALAHDLFIVGFDVCAEITGTPRGHLYDARGDCNVAVWSHNQAGGFALNNFVSKEFLFQNFSSAIPYLKQAFSIQEDDHTGQMQITYDVGTDGSDNHISPGDTVIVQGFGVHTTLHLTGDINTNGCSGSVVCAVHPDSTFDYPILGAQIYDGSGGCIPMTGMYHVVGFTPPGDSGPGTITLDHPPGSGCLSQEAITIQIDNVSPSAANGRWIVSCSAGGDGHCNHGNATLVGSSWNGPSLAAGANGAGWQNKRQFITVMDTTNIAPGQFACVSGTPPFCTPPTGWTVGSATLSGSAWNSDNMHLGTLTINGNTAGWPSYGYIQIDSEALCYDRILAPTQIDISVRGCDGTSPATHNNLAPITVAAPQVMGVSAGNNTVILNATATQTHTMQAMTFANDQHTKSAAIAVGSIGINPGYKTWAATTNVGGTPDASFSATANGSSSSATVSNLVNAWKAEPGMTVADLTHSAYIPLGTVVCSVSTTGTDTPLLGSITLAASYNPTTNACGASVTPTSSFTGDQLTFGGCGYPWSSGSTPFPQPWLGNCAASAYFFGDIGGTVDNTQGGLIYAINDHGHRRGIGSANWQDGHVSEVALGNGGSTGAQLDPTSYGATFQDSSRIDANDMSFQGAANSLYTSNNTGKQDGIGLVNPIFSASSVNGGMAIQTGPGKNTVLSIVQAKGNDNGLAFFSPQQFGTTLEADHLPNVQPVYGLDTSTTPASDAMLTTTGCGNVFANGQQCQLGTNISLSGPTPSVTAGLGATIGGNNSAGRITVGISGANSIVLTFAAPWANPPVCRATDETSATSLYATSVTTNSVTFTATTSLGSGDEVSYSCVGFG